MLTLYGVCRSRASRALWLLNETGTPFVHVPVIQAYRLADPAAAGASRNTASAEFLAVNPMGQIPALTDQGLVLTESLAIVLYLAKRYGGALGPNDLTEDALMTNWALFAASAIDPPALVILQAGTEDGDGVQAAVATLSRALARLDGHLEGRDWLLDRFTAADICVAECLRYAQGHGGLVAAHPAAFAWLTRCQARPAFQAMWAARALEPA
jgi:glutathione S-transferase